MSSCQLGSGTTSSQLEAVDSNLTEVSLPGQGFEEKPNSNFAHHYPSVATRPILRYSVYLGLTRSPHRFRTEDLVQEQVAAPSRGFGHLPMSRADTFLVVKHGSQSWANDNCDSSTFASCVATSNSAGTYSVTVFATGTGTYGTCDVWADASKLADDASFGGSLLALSIPSGRYSLQTVHTPAGATDTVLVLLDSAWHELAYNDNSGIGRAAKIVWTLGAGTYRLVVGARSASTAGQIQETSVIINECVDEVSDCSEKGDADDDRLSDALEADLGTDPSNQDTDGDGLFDYMEVIGHSAAGDEQELVFMGADPLRRDVFIEFDTVDKIPQTDTISESEIQQIQDTFWDLPQLPINPDGSQGIWIHADTGEHCSNKILCGDWGGHQRLPDLGPDYYKDKSLVAENFSPARQGLFHYAWRYHANGGQSAGAPATTMRINGDVSSTLCHELGHNLGLSHWGSQRPDSEQMNRKVAYPSLMNYLFQNRIAGLTGRSRFSEGLLESLDHRALIENGYSPGVDKTFMKDNLGFDVNGDTVDFNWDGEISSDPVMFDVGPLAQYRLGLGWPEVQQARTVSDDVPTGGGALAVDPLDGTGYRAKVWAFAPFDHGGQVYPDWALLQDRVGDLNAWDAWHQGEEIPGGGLPYGEVAAVPFDMVDGHRIVVTFPRANGKLYYNFFNDDFGFWIWVPIPGWPLGTRARQASMSVIDGEVVVMFRDLEAADDDPSIWVTRMNSAGEWDPWEQLPFASYTTPAMVEASDGKEYMAYVDPSSRSVFFVRRPAGCTGCLWEQLDYPFQQKTFLEDAEPEDRVRINLTYSPYRLAWGTPMPDGSGYLTLLWNSGDPGSQESWVYRRAHARGKITPAGSHFLASSAGWRAQKQLSRPLWNHSIGVAQRHWDTAVVYTSTEWRGDQSPQGVMYQPYGTGLSPFPARHDDNNDALVMDANLCKSVRLFTDDVCKCDASCD